MGVAAGVDFGVRLDADMGINLGGGELLVAEHNSWRLKLSKKLLALPRHTVFESGHEDVRCRSLGSNALPVRPPYVLETVGHAHPLLLAGGMGNFRP